MTRDAPSSLQLSFVRQVAGDFVPSAALRPTGTGLSYAGSLPLHDTVKHTDVRRAQDPPLWKPPALNAVEPISPAAVLPSDSEDRTAACPFEIRQVSSIVV